MTRACRHLSQCGVIHIIKHAHCAEQRIDRHVRISLLDTISWRDATIPFFYQRKTDDACSSRHKRASGQASKKAPRQNEAQGFVAQFENSVVHRDRTQIPDSHDIRRRHAAPIVETTLLLFLTKATSLSAQHFRHQLTQIEGSRISY